MSLTTCARVDCSNNGNKKYSPKYWNICDECFAELVTRFGEDANVLAFLNSEKPDVNRTAARARFEIEFPLIADAKN